MTSNEELTSAMSKVELRSVILNEELMSGMWKVEPMSAMSKDE